MTDQTDPLLSITARRALRTLATLCLELNRTVTHDEWAKALGPQMQTEAINELQQNGLVEFWRGAARPSTAGVSLLRKDGVQGLRPLECHVISGHTGPVSGPQAERIAGPQELFPFGYGDLIIRVSDDRYTSVDARPGDLLLFRQVHTVHVGDQYLKIGDRAEPLGLISATTHAWTLQWVLVTMIRQMTHVI